MPVRTRTPGHRPGRRPLAGALGVVVGLALLVGCSRINGDDASTARFGAAPTELGTAADGATGADEAVAGGKATAPAATVPPGEPLGVERSIISTASIRVRVADRARAADRAEALAVKAGGLVLASQADLVGTGDTTLTLKVPPARFGSVLASLADLGTPLERHTGVEDVTDQVVDLQGRLRTAEASAARLRRLLADASDVPGIVAIESELSTREAEVESLQGHIRVISAKVDMATIEVRLTERGEPKVSEDIPGFAQGLRRGWIAFRNSVAGVVTVVGFALPFLLVALPLAVALRWVLRRRTRRVQSA